jgi:hypothetical protein
MDERRLLHRNNLIFYLKVFDRNSDSLLGRLVNITPDGIMLISQHDIPTETMYDLRLEFPSDMFGEGAMDFSAESLWSKPDTNPDFFDTGFRFVNVSSENVIRIKKLITEFGFIS